MKFIGDGVKVPETLIGVITLLGSIIEGPRVVNVLTLSPVVLSSEVVFELSKQQLVPLRGQVSESSTKYSANEYPGEQISSSLLSFVK